MTPPVHGHHHHPHANHAHPHADPAGPNVLTWRHVGKLWQVFALTAVYMLVELAGGHFSHSLSLTADGFHMLGDTLSIGISLFAAWVSLRPASRHKTFGYQRAEIIAAFFNGVLLLLLAVGIFGESVERFQHPVWVNATLMLKIALGGLAVNVLAAWILHRDVACNLNIKGVYFHVLGDLLGAAGAVLASLVIVFFKCYWADPLIGGLIALLILLSAYQLLRESVNVLLDGCPSHIDITEIEREMLTFPGIEAVHHLHVWPINTQKIVLTAHLVVRREAFSAETLSTVQTVLREQFGLSHVTLQLEQA